MVNKSVQNLLLLTLLAALCSHCKGQGYLYTSISNPQQNSFAFATPSLRQTFTTKLGNTPLTQNAFPQNQFLAQFANQQLANQQIANQLIGTQQIASQYVGPQQFPNQQIYDGQQNPFAQNYVYPQNFPQQNIQFPQQIAQNGLLNDPAYQQQQQQAQIFDSQQQLQQQLAYLQLRQQQQRDSQILEQMTAGVAVRAPVAEANAPSKTQQLLGVVYSPSTKVSQVKFTSAKLKYDF